MGKRVQVDGVLQGEGVGLLDVFVAELVDRLPHPDLGANQCASNWVAPWTCWRAWVLIASERRRQGTFPWASGGYLRPIRRHHLPLT